MAERNKLITSKQLEMLALKAKNDSVTRVSELAELVAAGYGRSITIVLPSANWNNGAQKVRHTLFLANGSFCYFIYCEADVKAENIATNGELTFRCETAPKADLSVDILRLEVENMDGDAKVGKAFNLTGGADAVPSDRTVNGKELSADISLTAADVGAAASNHTHTAAQVGARPNTWTPTAADVGAAPVSHTHTAADVGAAPVSHGTHVSYSATAPKMDGAAAVGTAGTVARSDHVHPTDTSRAPVSHTHTAAQVGAAAANHTHTAADVGAAPASHTHTAAEVGAAAADHTHTAADVGAAAVNHTHNYASPRHTHTAADVGAVPTTRTVNKKALSANITLTASDVGAAAATHTHTAADVGAATADHTHTAADVGAAAANHTHNYASSSHTHTAADVGAVPTARKVNGKALSADVTLSAADVGARPSTWTPTAADVGAAAASHGTHVSYSTTAPKADGTAAAGTAGTVARSDHVHPTDTSRAPVSHTHSKSQITDFPTSLPASDVYSWAKAASKPAYTASEVGAAQKPLSGSITIPTTGWSSDSTATYSRYYDVAVTGVTASDRAHVDIAAAAWAAAIACGLCPITETLAGKIRIRAASVPAATISANYFVEKGA